MVDSQRVGVEKPDPAIFRAALGPLGATPEKTVLVGDSLHRDREGARRMAARCTQGQVLKLTNRYFAMAASHKWGWDVVGRWGCVDDTWDAGRVAQEVERLGENGALSRI